MRMFVTAVLLGAAISAAPVAQAKPRLTPQQKLDKMLEGRVAGKPVDCISLLDANSTQIINRTAIVYGSGRTIYVNRPSNPESLDDNDILVTQIRGGGSQLCRLDTVRLRDRSSFMFNGFVGLQEFVPYRRVPGAK
jgi:hypothetical protein